MSNAKIAQALKDALPLLTRLGDFIGNAEKHPMLGYLDRCAAIMAVREALTIVEPYILEGREWENGKGTAPCIFCGKPIQHINDGGTGWCCMSKVNGEPKAFLYCHSACDARDKDIENHPDFGSVWRCGCESDYVENVGDHCFNCGRPQSDPEPYPCGSCDAMITDQTAKRHYASCKG